MIKKILVPLDGTDVSLQKLPAAHLVAQRFKAHLDVLYLRRNPQDAMPFVFSPLGSQNLRKTVLDAAGQEEQTRSQHMQQQVSEFCQRHNIKMVTGPADRSRKLTARWQEDTASALIQHSRLSDLITVVRTPKDNHPWLLESVLLETARPVLLVPPTAPPTLGEHIVIGWNDSAEAATAVAAALSFLSIAQTVTILSAAKRKESAQELIEYLAWHSINADLRIFQTKRGAVGSLLLKEAAALNADLFVIGGYSHTRARQLLFGGVTQYFLSHADLPVLMAH